MESQLIQLKDLFKNGNDPTKCYQMAQNLRAQLLLQPATQNNNSLLSQILEISALLALSHGDFSHFDIFAAQLRSIYFADASFLQTASNAPLLIGLMLMRLLTDNKIAEFHMLLERIQNWSFVHSNQFISFPVALEQSLMEGSFRNVLQSVSNAPSPYISSFTGIIAQAVRETIATSCESSFQTLSLQDLGKLLFFSTIEEVKQFALSRNWKISGDNFHVIFGTVAPSVEHEASAYCTQMLLANLGLAREMESII